MTCTLAVVVSYNPPIEIIENVEQLLKQVEHVVVVDNGSSDSTRANLTGVNSPKVTCIFNDANKGVGEGFNQGMRWGLERDFGFFLLMDQDSRLEPGMVDELRRISIDFAGRGKIALIGPRHEDFERKLPISHSSDIEPCPLLITSGSLVSRALIQKVGLYDERLFIDHVDHDFSLRVFQAGGICLKANRAVLLHKFGEAKVKSLFGKTFFLQEYSPFRRYHMMRNRIVLYRRYGMFSGEWFWRDLRSAIVDLVKLIFFENDKGPKLKAVVSGVRDGFKWKD